MSGTDGNSKWGRDRFGEEVDDGSSSANDLDEVELDALREEDEWLELLIARVDVLREEDEWLEWSIVREDGAKIEAFGLTADTKAGSEEGTKLCSVDVNLLSVEEE